MMVFRENSWFWKISKGQEKFLTLDSRPKFRTQWLGPECQMGRAAESDCPEKDKSSQVGSTGTSRRMGVTRAKVLPGQSSGQPGQSSVFSSVFSGFFLAYPVFKGSIFNSRVLSSPVLWFLSPLSFP